MVELHAALEMAGAEPDEGDAVAVLGVHVRLDLEDEAGDRRLPGADRARLGRVDLGRRAEGADAGHQLLHAEGVDRRAEPDRREVAVEHRLVVEGGQQRARHRDLLAQRREQVGGDVLGHARVVEALHLDALGALVAVGAVHQLEPVVQHVVAAEEVAALADRPGGRADVELQLVLDLVDDLKGVAGLAVHLVAEGQDRQVAQPADLEELAGLALDALGAVDHHDRGVDRGQRAVGVLGEVGVAGGVDEVEPPVAEREGHRRGGDGDAALLLHLHEVGAGAPRLALGAHLAGHLDGAAVEQELLGQRGLAGVGVRDDREGAAPGDLGRQGGRVGGRSSMRRL